MTNSLERMQKHPIETRNKAIELRMKTLIRFFSNFYKIFHNVRAVLLAFLLILVLDAVIMSFVENLPLWKAMYFVFITGLTIGSSGIFPTTVLGYIMHVSTGFLGILFMGLVVAVASRALTLTYKDEENKKH
jgi:hypothetical protein